MTSYATESGTSFGPELLLPLRGPRLRVQLEERLRHLIRDGTLPAGTRLPSSRALAADTRLSRRLVVDAYGQLVAEGYLVSRRGAGTYVAAAAGAAPAAPDDGHAPAMQFDFFPGAPDLASFPRALWLRALRDVLRTAPARAFGYPDPRGTPELRAALATYLRRVRGVVAEPGSILICGGATQGLALVGRTLARRGLREIAVEDPGLPQHRWVLAAAGLEVRGVPVDGRGIDAAVLDGGAVLTTPAHQCPTGVVLAPERRAALIEWARDGALVIEDDYDAEFRYDRAPVGALQGLAPDRVIYLGTTSKTLAPGLRLGWLVLPPELFGQVAEAKLLDDFGSPAIEQLTLARLLATAAYDRHLRKARRRNRARRDALIAAVAEHLPEARLSGVSAGLHALVRLAEPVDAGKLVAEAARRSVAIYPLGFYSIEPPPLTDAVVLGYANLPEAAIHAGVRLLGEALIDAR
jgi:GntR family transcriptional regulator/MocR family aminotransferase